MKWCHNLIFHRLTFGLLIFLLEDDRRCWSSHQCDYIGIYHHLGNFSNPVATIFGPKMFGYFCGQFIFYGVFKTPFWYLGIFMYQLGDILLNPTDHPSIIQCRLTSMSPMSPMSPNFNDWNLKFKFTTLCKPPYRSTNGMHRQSGGLAVKSNRYRYKLRQPWMVLYLLTFS